MIRDTSFGLPFPNGGGNNPPPIKTTTTDVTSPNKPSVELTDVIVNSLDSIVESLSDAPVNQKQVEEAVTKGINKSKIIDLIKKDKGKGGSSSSGGSGSESDKYWKQKRLIEYQNYLKSQEREEENSRKERDRNINEKIDKVFSQLNEFSRNPLKGFSDLIDKGIKGVFKALVTPVDVVGAAKGVVKSGKNIASGIGKGIGGIRNATAAAVGFSKGFFSKDEPENNDTTAEELEGALQEDDLEKEKKESEQEEKEEKRAEQEDKNSKEQIKETKSNGKGINMIGLSVAGILLTLGGLAVGIPILVAHTLDFFITLPLRMTALGDKLLLGLNNLGDKLIVDAKSMLQRAFGLDFSDNQYNAIKATRKKLKDMYPTDNGRIQFGRNLISKKALSEVIFESGVSPDGKTVLSDSKSGFIANVETAISREYGDKISSKELENNPELRAMINSIADEFYGEDGKSGIKSKTKETKGYDAETDLKNQIEENEKEYLTKLEDDLKSAAGNSELKYTYAEEAYAKAKGRTSLSGNDEYAFDAHKGQWADPTALELKAQQGYDVQNSLGKFVVHLSNNIFGVKVGTPLLTDRGTHQ